jgi:hypothetical protein
MGDPTIEAAREILDESLDALGHAIEGASVEELSWRPAPDANSVVVLVVHGLHSTRWWLSVATGAAMPDRDRPSEFLAEAESQTELATMLSEMGGECQALLAGAGEFQPAATWTHPTDGDVLTRAWALLHALEHLREHVAQALLTRQAWSARQT